jgi:hypothetical protein
MGGKGSLRVRLGPPMPSLPPTLQGGTPTLPTLTGPLWNPYGTLTGPLRGGERVGGERGAREGVFLIAISLSVILE